MLRLRVAWMQKRLMPVDEAVAHIDAMVGLFLTRLSGFAARCGGRDLAARRVIDKAVYDLRTEISEAAIGCRNAVDQYRYPYESS